MIEVTNTMRLATDNRLEVHDFRMSEVLAPDFAIDELDLAVVGALQLNPRASWADVGRILGIDASTVSRRWTRLADAGAAWVSCQPLFTPVPALAFIEITTVAGRTLDVATELAGDAQAMTIDVAAGARDLLVTAVCMDAYRLSAYLLERVSRIPDVRSVQSHIIAGAYAEASRWRLHSLESQQEARVRETLPKRPSETTRHELGERDHALVAALSRDGRASLAELAEVIHASETTARRRLDALIARGHVRLRCELARDLTGFPVSEWFFVRVPSDRIDAAAKSLATIPEVRAVLSAAGPFNLLVAVWLRNVADGQRLETQVMRKLPHVEFVDRSVVIRPFKLVGRMLDARGFATGVVPLELGRSS